MPGISQWSCWTNDKKKILKSKHKKNYVKYRNTGTQRQCKPGDVGMISLKEKKNTCRKSKTLKNVLVERELSIYSHRNCSWQGSLDLSATGVGVDRDGIRLTTPVTHTPLKVIRYTWKPLSSTHPPPHCMWHYQGSEPVWILRLSRIISGVLWQKQVEKHWQSKSSLDTCDH